jgi:hypothetical protein
MNALFSGAEPDPNLKLTVVSQPLHRSVRQKELVREWDGVQIDASNDVVAYGFRRQGQDDRRLLAVWNEQAYSRQFNNRVATLELQGWEAFDQPPVAIDLLNGESFDVTIEVREGALRLPNLSLGQAPLAIWFFRE